MNTIKKDIYDNTLKKEFFTEFIFSSSVTENIKLNLSDIKKILNLQPKDVKKFLSTTTNPDVIQALGQKRALEEIEKWVMKRKSLSVDMLFKIHKLVFKELDKKATDLRSENIRLKSSYNMPTFPSMIKNDIEKFQRWLRQKQWELDTDREDIIAVISKAYHEINRIHPFSDGNGRTARLFVNLILRRYNLPHIFIPKVSNNKEMRDAITDADKGDLTKSTKFMRKLLDHSIKEVENYWKKKSKTS